jgi:hypothetical protein
MAKQPIVSSLSMAFKKATKVTEDREEAKKEHRETLKMLMERYVEDVHNGKADGIRTAKELVEVMKMDLLLMGEATERTDNVNDFDEVRVQKISQAVDLTSDTIRSTLATMLKTLNDANDEADIGTNKKSKTDEFNDYEGKSIMVDDDALLELANQAMQDYEDGMQVDEEDPKE